MLVLTRKHQEKIRIGDHITITVLKTKGKTVRLGIEAPAEIPVIRGELSFAGQEVEWVDAPSESADEPEPRGRRKQPQVDRVRDHWPAASKGTVPSPHVSLQRVSREHLNKVLPKVIGGSAPLRALVERRSVSA